MKRKPSKEKSSVYGKIHNYEDLDNQAYLTYGNRFHELDRKEQLEIATKVQKKTSYSSGKKKNHPQVKTNTALGSFKLA